MRVRRLTCGGCSRRVSPLKLCGSEWLCSGCRLERKAAVKDAAELTDAPMQDYVERVRPYADPADDVSRGEPVPPAAARR